MKNVFEKIAQESMINELEKIAIEGDASPSVLKRVGDFFSGNFSSAKQETKDLYTNLKGIRNPTHGTAADHKHWAKQGVKKLVKNPLVYAPLGAAAVGGVTLALRKRKQTTGQKFVSFLKKNKLGVGLGLGAGALGAAAISSAND